MTKPKTVLKASNNGYGTDDTLAITQVLEQHGISCCMVGIAALVFYVLAESAR